jgi:hypothetical protein
MATNWPRTDVPMPDLDLSGRLVMNFSQMEARSRKEAGRNTDWGGRIGVWVEEAIATATNKQPLQRQLDSIESDDQLLRFLHRFVLFNDALAARVSFLAGIIHLTPNVFVDPEADEEFCRQYNGRIAAYVALAASDAYLMSEHRSLVHQHLSQQFFRGALAHYDRAGPTFDRLNPLPYRLAEIVAEARSKFFDRKGPEQIFAALGFHVGLELFANKEFNLVDAYLREHHPALVASLEEDHGNGPAYEWLALHTVVEVGRYRAGREALDAAVRYYHDRDAAPLMATRVKDGFNAFVDIQKRYYEAIFCDAN